MINAIYASKLYKVSKRKPAIVAAANDPVNTELVTQLADALSPVYRKEDYLVDKEAEEAKARAEEKREAEEAVEDEKVIEDDAKKSMTSPPKSEHSSNLHESFKKAERSEEDFNEQDSKEPSDNPEDDVENSTSSDAEPIVAATRSLVIDMKQQVDQIKGLLNLEDTTTGVNRILVKDSELWIYYNDNINLNNVMANAIESLNAAGYTYLEFNRLARSDNAMVFQIMFKDTAIETKPANYEEENNEKNS